MVSWQQSLRKNDTNYTYEYIYIQYIQQTQNILHTVRLHVHTNLLERVKKHRNYLEHLI